MQIVDGYWDDLTTFNCLCGFTFKQSLEDNTIKCPSCNYSRDSVDLCEEYIEVRLNI